AAAFVQDQVEPEEGLQPAAEARPRFAHALGDRVDPPACRRVEMEDAIRLPVANAAQDDRLGLHRLSGHAPTLTGEPDGGLCSAAAGGAGGPPAPAIAAGR